MHDADKAPMLDARAMAWRRLASDRIANAHRRSVFCLISGVIAAGLFQSWVPVAWCGLVALAYAIDLQVWRRVQVMVAPQATAALFAWVFVQAFIATGLGPIVWLVGGNAGKVVAAYFLSAGIFNALATFKGDRRMLAIGVGAPLILLFALPIFDFVAATNKDATLLIPLLGAVVLGLFSFSIWKGVTEGEDTRVAEQTAALEERARADEAAESQARLLGTVERELRAPLQALTTATAKLMQLEAPAETKRQLRAAHDAGEVLSLAVSDLSALSSLQAGSLRTKPARVDPRALAEALADSWRGQAQAKWIELFVDVSPGMPEAVALDGRRVSQVLHQLLANSVRFTRHGGVRLRVETAAGRDGQALWIAFTVSDTGPGIDPQRLAEVVSPGDRIGRATARGYGLGTAISACVAEAMGGQLKARSVIGQGTSFSLVVPTRALAPGEEVEGEGHSDEPPRKAWSILVVDDNAASRRLASVFLNEIATHVATASAGERALAILARETFDLVLMDLRMPGMDGYALAGTIRGMTGPGRDVPIVAYSAEASMWDLESARAAGIGGFVAKPFTPSTLFAEITRVVGLRHAGQAGGCDAPPRGAKAAGAVALARA
jgi:signal transduction histidine kinase/ActR/RegA family two-component response regulator